MKIIDMHAHVWLSHDTKSDVRQMRRAAEDNGVTRIFISPLGSHRPDKDEVEALNMLAKKVCAEHGDLFSRYVYVNPAEENALDVLQRGMDEGCVGLKLWIATLCNDPCVFPLVEACIKRRFPILLHAFQKTVNGYPAESDGRHVADIAARYPDAKFIMAHLGANCYHGVKAVRHLENVYLDFCGSICGADDLPFAIEQVGVDRLLFGTDMPGNYHTSAAQVKDADITDVDREKIFYGNAKTLFGL